MNIGSWKQKANPRLTVFVFGCIFIITGLLVVQEKATTRALEFSYSGELNYGEN